MTNNTMISNESVIEHDQSPEVDKVAAAIAKASASVHKVGKSGNNTFDKYTYGTLEDYIKACHDALAENELAVLSSVREYEVQEPRQSKQGGAQYAILIRLELTILHSSGQWIKVHAIGEGQDRSDKATYKAITGARKYALAMAFNLVTSDDPERDSDERNGGQQTNGQSAPSNNGNRRGRNNNGAQAQANDPLVNAGGENSDRAKAAEVGRMLAKNARGLIGTAAIDDEGSKLFVRRCMGSCGLGAESMVGDNNEQRLTTLIGQTAQLTKMFMSTLNVDAVTGFDRTMRAVEAMNMHPVDLCDDTKAENLGKKLRSLKPSELDDLTSDRAMAAA